MQSIVTFVALLLVLAPIGSLAAQRDTLGAIEGTIHERSSFRSVMTARVAVRRVAPDTMFSASAVPDARGRFRVDSLPPGRYRARVLSPSLDSLQVALPASEVAIAPGRVMLADFTLPGGTTLREAVCRGERLAERRGAVAGRAIDADADDRPLVGAELVAIWMEFPMDRSTHRSIPTRRVVVVKSGQAGEYRICGVPTETLFTLQLRSQGRASAVLQLMIAEDEGAIARDLSLSARTSPTIAALDSAASAAARKGHNEPAEELQTVGTSELSGTVRGLSGEPFVGAHVHVRHARASAVTDRAGRFVLGELPAGTQMLVVRHPGYTLAELPAELRPGKRTERDVLLVRPVTLDAIQATDLEAFDAMRRTNPYGQFLTQEQIDRKKHATETVDLFDDLLGFTALGRGENARVISNMALASHRKCSEASVIMQGAQGRRINDVTPSQIAGIEAYADAAFVPGRFAGQADCGVVVIWLRKSTTPTSHAATGLRANGYP
ncbi:MAG: carboxypeptidase-like regulatory domain-containing protein [Gemmatimonadaceae bacterium]